MTENSIETIFRTLNDAGVRYLVVGGLAVNALGYLRYTADVDLILSFEPSNVRTALRLLKGLQYVPRAPVAIEEFADPAKRKLWIEEKGLKAFSLFSPRHPDTEIDLFIDDPLGFDRAAGQAVWFDYANGVKIPVCGVADLLALKRAANRPKDLIDIQKLKTLYPDVP